MPTRESAPGPGAEDANIHRQDTTSPTSLGGVLDRIVEFLSRFLWTQSDHQLNTLALWVLHTHLIDAFDVTPYLEISAPEKRCGKTRVLELLDLLCHEPVLSINMSVPAMFRLAPDQHTFLIDEFDAIYGRGGDEDKRAFINSGYKRGAKAARVGGPPRDLKVEFFDTYCAKALAGIGNLPDTVADRAIPIRLQRIPPSIRLDRFRLRAVKADPALDQLKGDIAEVAEAHQASIGLCYPTLPDELHDRAQEIWEPLLAIATVAGGPWPAGAHAAAVALHTGGDQADSSTGVELLADIRDVFGDEEKLHTRTLLDRLCGLDEAAWGDWYGKPITARFLATRLKPYQIHSKDLRIDESVLKGYERGAFTDAFDRYLPATSATDATSEAPQGIPADSVSATVPQQSATPADVADVLPIVAATENAETPTPATHVADVADVAARATQQDVIDAFNAEVATQPSGFST